MKQGLLALLLFAGLLWPAKLHALVIAENSQSAYDIVIRANAPQTTSYAANELKAYLKKVAEVDAAVLTAKAEGRKAIYVGTHPELPQTVDFASEKYEGSERFRIAELADGDISIMGAECDANPVSRQSADFGLLFGTYEFIERFLGVRWYTPGEFGEAFEPLEKVEASGLPIDQKPAYFARAYWPFKWNEFSARESLVFNRRVRAFGTRSGSANHSMQDFYFPYHETRPDFFALRLDGKREFGGFRPGTQPSERRWAGYPHFCLTNPDLVKAYCDAIDAYYAKDPKANFWKFMHPDEHFVYVMPDDCFNLNKCHCKNCQEMLTDRPRAEMSNLVFSFVKKVAEHVQRKYPDKKVLTNPYESYYYPPDFRLPDNVVVSICADPYFLFYGSKRYRDSFEKTLKMWSEKAKEVTIWHYYLPYRDAYPYQMPHIADKWYREYPQIRGCFIELNDTKLAGQLAGREMRINPEYGQEKTTADLGQNYLTFYFSMKAMWGAPVNVDAELDYHYRLFYGPAAADMKRFFTLLIDRWENVKSTQGNVEGMFAKFSGKELYEEIYTGEVIDQLEEAIVKAEKAVSADSIHAKRIAWIRKSHFNDFVKVARAYQRNAKLSNDTVLTVSRETPPTIDGVLDDPFWKGLPEHGFLLANAPLPPRYGTKFKMGFREDGRLYIGVHASDPDILTAKMVCKDRDTAVYDDDSLEFFFRTDDMPAKALRNITVNQNGVVLDYEKFGKIDRSWNSTADIRIFRGEDFYSLEMALPLAEIGIDPTAANPLLRMNVCRSKRSGVGQSHEQSCWIPVYGNFHNVMDLPAIVMVGKGDAALEDFASANKVFLSRIVTVDGKPKSAKDLCRLNNENGELQVFITYPEGPNFYGNLHLTRLEGAELENARTIEIRFRSPDPSLDHMACWSYVGKDGKNHSDWHRFSSREIHENFSIRTFDVARDGHNARQREVKGLPSFEPVTLNYFAIYTYCNKRDGSERSYVLDYVRVTGNPASGMEK
ncbi:MAG: DUF4838 domain-containing protein [Victivallales bacterium]|nr:DUF4838 domain-containing protein [Victivallales bacterium]